MSKKKLRYRKGCLDGQCARLCIYEVVTENSNRLKENKTRNTSTGIFLERDASGMEMLQNGDVSGMGMLLSWDASGLGCFWDGMLLG